MVATIVAQATPPGVAGIQVIRSSGPKSIELLHHLTNRNDFSPRRLTNTKLYHPNTNKVIDFAMVVTFEGPASFTGENVVEYHVHGAPVIARMLLSVMTNFEDVRLARPGEFTERSLLNNKMNLLEVEALGRLLNAQTMTEIHQIHSVFDGQLANEILQIRNILVKIMTAIEASIDFDDEGDVPADVTANVLSQLSQVKLLLNKIYQTGERNQNLFDGLVIAIAGQPNVGKSSLLNFLAGHDLALVSEHKGTTRDVISAPMILGDRRVVVCDTAGIRKTDDEVELMGIERSHEMLKKADLRVILTEYPPTAEDKELLELWPDALHVVSKSDMYEDIPESLLSLSTITTNGADSFLHKITELVQAQEVQQNVGLITQRQQYQCLEALNQIIKAEEMAQEALLLDLFAEHVRAAVYALDGLIGKVNQEEILGEIFSNFCIGK